MSNQIKIIFYCIFLFVTLVFEVFEVFEVGTNLIEETSIQGLRDLISIFLDLRINLIKITIGLERAYLSFL